jgi:hypothetical protein
MSHQDTRIRFLTLSNLASWSVLSVLLFSAFKDSDDLRVTLLEAERVNILGIDGEPVMALSNRRFIPGPTFEHKEYPQAFGDGRDLLSGIIFFNEQGDEVGGLVYNGVRRDSGYWAGGHLSFDQWKQNQVVALQYLDNSRSRRAGLRVWDRPSDVRVADFFDLGLARMQAEDQAVRDSLRTEMQAIRDRGDLGVERLFVGSQDQVAQVQLRDTDGRVRARLFVGPTGEARLEFLDAAGNVMARYPAP